ncbi:hypothetical protein [Noviherbaspirillum cavernae]|nr:hypothetical protein [Noviherbaspirillum cavernae]
MPSRSASAPGRTPSPMRPIMTTGHALACDSAKPAAILSATDL